MITLLMLNDSQEVKQLIEAVFVVKVSANFNKEEPFFCQKDEVNKK